MEGRPEVSWAAAGAPTALRAHTTPDPSNPDTPPPQPSPDPDDVPAPQRAPIEEPRMPQPPIKAD